VRRKRGSRMQAVGDHPAKSARDGEAVSGRRRTKWCRGARQVLCYAWEW